MLSARRRGGFGGCWRGGGGSSLVARGVWRGRRFGGSLGKLAAREIRNVYPMMRKDRMGDQTTPGFAPGSSSWHELGVEGRVKAD